MDLPNLYKALSMIAMQLTLLIDTGRHDSITIGEVRDHIRRDDVMEWLKSLDPKRIDISLFSTEGIYPLEAREWLEGLERQLNAYSMKDDFGIEKRGLCMLLTLTVEQLRFEIDRVVTATKKKAQEAEEPTTPPRKH